MYALGGLVLSEPAIGTSDHVLFPDQLRKANNPVRDDARMLHRGEMVRHDAWNQGAALWQAMRLPHPPFVLVPRIRCFNGIGTRAHLQNQIDDGLERRV